MHDLSKFRLLLSLAFARPREFVDRVSIALSSRLHGQAPPRATFVVDPLDVVFEEVSSLLEPTGPFIVDDSIRALESEIALGIASIGDDGPFRATQSSDPVLARLCYAACRSLRPSTVLETGVAYGVTSAFILAALERNGHGRLISIDLPQLAPEADRHVGILIPAPLRARWTLLKGTSRRLLPQILEQLPGLEMFVHDSLHTEANMRFEFDAVFPKLSRPAVLISDDIEGNSAFLDFTRRANPTTTRIVTQNDKPGLIGVCVFR